MFELEKSSVFFEQMSAAHPTIVQNIEVVFDNGKMVDASYHQPKEFILGINNLLRAVLFFIENSVKNSPTWLNQSVKEYLVGNQDAYQMLRHLRNVSAHQKLVFPDESLVTGLYRIRSPGDYKLKLGIGDHNKPGKYAWDLAFKNTEDIFHDMLVLESLMYMDLQHSAYYECLGITRRWYFKLKFKTKEKKYNEIVDVYELASSFSSSLLDHVCSRYAREIGVSPPDPFSRELKECNYINTLLEIDLYPSLFRKWWGDDYESLNYGVRRKSAAGYRIEAVDHLHKWVFENLSKDKDEYRDSLSEMLTLDPETIFTERYQDFLSIIQLNHWHYKNSFDEDIIDSIIEPSEVMMLQRAGNILMEEYRKGKLCTIASAKSELDERIKVIFMKLDAREK